MRDADVAALVDRIVTGARITDRRRREDLRRELWTHFDEAGVSPEDRDATLGRFGAETVVTDSFRRVYRGDYILRYAAKIAASIAASVAAALAIEAAVNLRVGLGADGWRLMPGFSHGAALAVAIVFGLVALAEAGRRPFTIRRALGVVGTYSAVAAIVSLLLADSLGLFATATLLAASSAASTVVTTRTAKALLTFAAFAVAEYALHRVLHVNFGAVRAAAAGGVLVAVWASTAAIVWRVDRAFISALTTA